MRIMLEPEYVNAIADEMLRKNPPNACEDSERY